MHLDLKALDFAYEDGSQDSPVAPGLQSLNLQCNGKIDVKEYPNLISASFSHKWEDIVLQFEAPSTGHREHLNWSTLSKLWLELRNESALSVNSF